ncbi:MAG TPA: hypothetical protein VJ901_10175, partial [Thermoanaerobaculia bacterium]|nr:hypothetical protein [Thermoanaerobaculia bacterium]
SGGTLSIGGVTSPAAFVLNSGTMTGAGFLSANTFDWHGGTITGSGSTQLNGSGSGTWDGANGPMLLDGRAFNDYGFLNFSATTNPLTLNNSAAFSVYGTMALQNDGTIDSDGTGAFSVAPNGLLWKTGGTGTSTISAPFSNTASVISTSGELLISGDGTSSGSFYAGSGAEIAFSASSTLLSSGSSVFADGTISFPGGSTSFSGCCFSVNDLEIYGGTLTMFTSGEATDMMFDAGTLGIALNQTFTLHGSGDWTSGVMNGSGTFLVDSGASFTINGISGNTAIAGITFQNDGSVAYTTPAPNQLTTSGATITNNGMFDIQTDQPIAEAAIVVGDVKKTAKKKPGSNGLFISSSAINNYGTFQKSSGTGTTNVDPAFTNVASTAAMNAQSGTLDFTTSYTQTDGTTTLGAGNITVATLNLNGGVLNGMGTITGDLANNGGNVSPGTTATCTINVTGNYTQASGGTLSIDIDSAALNDTLAVGGAATLDGTFTANLNYPPVIGTSWTPLTFASRTGDFSTYNLPSLIAASYTPTSLLLTAVAPQTDLSAAVSGPASVNAAAPLSYTVDITNNGPNTTGGTTTVVDTLPAGVTGASALGTNWSCGVPSAGTITCTSIDAIANGSQFPSILVSMLAPANGGTISNSATVSSPFDGNGANNTASASTTVTSQADLQITKTGPGGVTAGQNVTYTVTITNNGPSDAANVSVSDSTPAGVGFVSNTGGCTGTYPCNLGTLTSGQVVTITSTYSTSGTTPSNVTNTASVSSTTNDPDNSNNSDSASTNVGPQADLSISKTGTASATPGQTVTYTIIVTNNGPSAAASTVVTDVTPAGLAFVSNSGACTTQFPCSLGTLAAGVPQTITSTYTVASNFAGASITNTASVSSSINDPNTTDNTASATTTIVQQADLQITKSGPPSASPGNLIVYTVTVSNLGPSTAGSIVVTDATPAGLTFVSNGGACSGTYPCGIGSLNAGQSASITSTYSIPANYGSSSVTNTASVSSAASDANPSNDSSSVTTPVAASADLSIVKSGPSSFTPGANISYTINVTNNGPLSAANVFVTDATPAGLTWMSNNGACTTTFPCSLGTLTSGQTKTITATFFVPPSYSGSTIVNTASVSSSTNDGNSANNSSTSNTPVATGGVVDLLIVKSGFPTAAPSSNVTFQLAINNNSNTTATNISVTDPTPSGLAFIGNAGDCTTAFPCTIASLGPHQTVHIQATYFVQAQSGSITNTASVSSPAADPQPANNTSSFTFDVTQPPLCPNVGPVITAPANHSTVTSPVTLSWTAVLNATQYVVTINGGGPPQTITTNATSTAVNLANGTYNWSVSAIAGNGCNPQPSAPSQFSVCTPLTEAPSAGIPGQMTTGQNYTLEWNDIIGAAIYEVQEATDDSFSDASSTTTGATKKTFSKNVSAPTQLFYRVRAITNCNATGPFSPTVAIVIVPFPDPKTPSPSVNVPVGSTKPVTFQIFIPGLPGITTSFFVTADKPWISITPVSGIVGPEGTFVTISLDPSHLDNGTWTGTVLVVYGSGGVSSKIHADANNSTAIPVSVNVVTPVTPQPLTGASSTALVVPSLGFLANGASTWRSDIRIANLGSALAKYLLSFNNGSSTMKQTFVNIAGGTTTALDDFVRSWFGVGPLGDSANGALTIQALDSNGKPVTNNLATIVSSRTFNAIGTSTLGQFIPATPFANFIGKAAQGQSSILTLQQIAQSNLLRTNLGLVEGANKSANILVSVFNGAGNKLLDIPTSLRGGEQKQLNSFLAQNNVTLDNGHVEVQVTGGDGRVTAYASVIDNASSDPFFVTGVPLGSTNANRFVVPGVAEVESDAANWRSDLRVFNGSNATQSATLTFYPSANASNPVTQQVTINPGEVKAFDNVLQSAFGVTNSGGVLHVTTDNNAPLVVTARTYDQTNHGTVGQFIPAITPSQSVGSGDRALQILQLEESPRYRTNLGIAEVNGKPAIAEISVVLPDSKVSPVVQVPLGAYEFIQLPVLSNLGIGNVYNTRISVRVIDGDGKVTAYGSVIDRNTFDATYVPAQ